VAGINQALEDGLRGGPEFEESGTAPTPWHAWTPLGIFLVQHILFSTFPNKLFRAHVARTLGPDAVGLFSIEAPVWSGSNAWAVHGSATASGRPLIAGDPHRLLELPGVYQQVRLACPEFDAIGFAFPGVPGLPHFGHTGHTAWAITNAMADYQDLFEEELRRVSAGAAPAGTEPAASRPAGIEARGPLGWEPAVVGTETIHVRGGRPVEVDIIETARGPVIAGGPDGGALSLRFPARVEGRTWKGRWRHGWNRSTAWSRPTPPALSGTSWQGWYRSGTTLTAGHPYLHGPLHIPGQAYMCRCPALTCHTLP
jgi:penicillin amidase